MNRFLKITGSLLIIGGLSLIGLIYTPIFKKEFHYQIHLAKPLSQEDKEVIPQSKEFGLVIPKIDINVRVFAEVDPNNPKEYLPLLTKGAAHAKGSALPGHRGNVFIFAHSADTPLNITRYNAVFYLISKLEPNDEIIVYYQEEKYLYEVTEKKIIPSELVTESLRNLKGKTLTLQTCTPPGTTINRLLVIAKEKD